MHLCKLCKVNCTGSNSSLFSNFERDCNIQREVRHRQLAWCVHMDCGRLIAAVVRRGSLTEPGRGWRPQTSSLSKKKSFRMTVNLLTAHLVGSQHVPHWLELVVIFHFKETERMKCRVTGPQRVAVPQRCTGNRVRNTFSYKWQVLISHCPPRTPLTFITCHVIFFAP